VLQIDTKYIAPLYDKFNNKKWDKFNSEKICHITYARIQVRGGVQEVELMSSAAFCLVVHLPIHCVVLQLGVAGMACREKQT
jgi:RNA recognition motif 2